jgi:hypothetical protein
LSAGWLRLLFLVLDSAGLIYAGLLGKKEDLAVQNSGVDPQRLFPFFFAREAEKRLDYVMPPMFCLCFLLIQSFVGTYQL